ncbi:hypothetical protein ACCS75_36200, partial [Rhizobium ruizarguesonis]
FITPKGGIRKLLEPAIDDDARPTIARTTLIDLQTDVFVRAHPFDISAGHRKAVNHTLCIIELDRHHERLANLATGQVA